MKKRLVFIGIIFILVLIYSNCSYAVSQKISTKVNQEETENNRIQVEVSIDEMKNIGEGINAYTGELVFNPDQLKLVDIKGENNWNTPSYSKENAEEGNTKVVATANDFTDKTGVIFVATFEKKIKDEVESVKVSNFEVAAKIDGKTVKVVENNTEEKVIQQTQKDYARPEKKNDEKKSNFWMIIGISIVSCILIIGVLSIGFGLFKKKKGGE